MAATVSIVFRAINATKAAFQYIGNQIQDLNSKINAVGKLFRGLFIAGVAARFTKELLEASTYTDKLAESSKEIKSAWRNVAEDIGDAFAEVFIKLTPFFVKLASLFNSGITKIKEVSAYLGARAGGASPEDAKKIAKDTVVELEKEQSIRRDNVKRKQQEIEAEKEMQKLRESSNEKNKKRLDELIPIHQRIKKLIEDQGNVASQMSQAAISGDRLRFEKLRAEFESLDELILDLQDKQSKSAIENIEREHNLKMENLSAQLQKSKETQKELEGAAKEVGVLATDPAKRREAKQALKEEAREARRQANLLKEAERKIAMGGYKLSEAEQLAITQRELNKAAAGEGTKQKQLEYKMEHERREALSVIKDIRNKVNAVLAFK